MNLIEALCSLRRTVEGLVYFMTVDDELTERKGRSGSSNRIAIHFCTGYQLSDLHSFDK